MSFQAWHNEEWLLDGCLINVLEIVANERRDGSHHQRIDRVGAVAANDAEIEILVKVAGTIANDVESVQVLLLGVHVVHAPGLAGCFSKCPSGFLFLLGSSLKKTAKQARLKDS